MQSAVQHEDEFIYLRLFLIRATIPAISIFETLLAIIGERIVNARAKIPITERSRMRV